MDHRMEAAQFVAKSYYNQDPRLLTFVLSKPPDRVKYTNLKPLRKDFEEIQALGVESGVLQGTVRFEDYVDTSFVNDEATLQAYAYDGRTNLPSAGAAQQPQ
jgi:NitT/TauT family transport system substrate-binding protein